MIFEYKRVLNTNINSKLEAALANGFRQILFHEYANILFQGLMKDKWDNILLFSIVFYSKGNPAEWEAKIEGDELTYEQIHSLVTKIDTYRGKTGLRMNTSRSQDMYVDKILGKLKDTFNGDSIAKLKEAIKILGQK